MPAKAKQFKVEIKEVKKIKKDIYLVSFSSAYLAKTARPGNFLQLKIEPAILRRPLSIHKIENDLVFILFRVRGKGTKALSKKKSGDQLDIIGPLGRGFKIRKGKNSILVAGGVGVAPLLFLAREIGRRQKTEGRRQKLEGRSSVFQNIVLLGAGDKDGIVSEEEFRKLGFQVEVATENGSRGCKGFVTDLLKKRLTAYSSLPAAQIYACGPKEMFNRIKELIKNQKKVRAQVSFEQFMGCGLGACSACVIPTKDGYKKVCKDGPVFDLEDI